jgi:hypothetical protein
LRDRPTTFCCGEDQDALQIARSLAACLNTHDAGFELAVRHHGNW